MSLCELYVYEEQEHNSTGEKMWGSRLHSKGWVTKSRNRGCTAPKVPFDGQSGLSISSVIVEYVSIVEQKSWILYILYYSSALFCLIFGGTAGSNYCFNWF